MFGLAHAIRVQSACYRSHAQIAQCVMSDVSAEPIPHTIIPMQASPTQSFPC